MHRSAKRAFLLVLSHVGNARRKSQLFILFTAQMGRGRKQNRGRKQKCEVRGVGITNDWAKDRGEDWALGVSDAEKALAA